MESDQYFNLEVNFISDDAITGMIQKIETCDAHFGVFSFDMEKKPANITATTGKNPTVNPMVNQTINPTKLNDKPSNKPNGKPKLTKENKRELILLLNTTVVIVIRKKKLLPLLLFKQNLFVLRLLIRDRETSPTGYLLEETTFQRGTRKIGSG